MECERRYENLNRNHEICKSDNGLYANQIKILKNTVKARSGEISRLKQRCLNNSQSINTRNEKLLEHEVCDELQDEIRKLKKKNQELLANNSCSNAQISDDFDDSKLIDWHEFVVTRFQAAVTLTIVISGAITVTALRMKSRQLPEVDNCNTEQKPQFKCEIISGPMQGVYVEGDEQIYDEPVVY
jgi:hypothetical protein